MKIPIGFGRVLRITIEYRYAIDEVSYWPQFHTDTNSTFTFSSKKPSEES